MISFKGAHFPKDVILYAVFFYVRYGVSYRDLEAIMEALLNKSKFGQSSPFLTLVRFLRTQACLDLSFC